MQCQRCCSFVEFVEVLTYLLLVLQKDTTEVVVRHQMCWCWQHSHLWLHEQQVQRQRCCLLTFSLPLLELVAAVALEVLRRERTTWAVVPNHSVVALQLQVACERYLLVSLLSVDCWIVLDSFRSRMETWMEHQMCCWHCCCWVVGLQIERMHLQNLMMLVVHRRDPFVLTCGSLSGEPHDNENI